ncbi:hypothetical protein GW17_00047658, partial [Ensete ventricosum]
MRKQGRTALGSKTRSSPFPRHTDSASRSGSDTPLTRPAMTRHTSIPLRPAQPPPLACAPPLPAKVRTPSTFLPADHTTLRATP